ncbi:restriction endonuclease subunit S [Ralstonia mojiangensis]|uniref:restriction endonuclease subunit S n=1 Tax=Ralstonia mojiangensis TaxID=2953895 RepID=UPI0021B408A3|nr:restriction endonuclease subunit S [Ralstonia mojiangensis]MCT7326250.1 restriction endonuclease subunit S [Ralstonia mojiangensis]
MSLPRYAKSRDSGIPWVGQLPEHWQVTPLLSVARERSESNVGMKEDNLLSLSYGRIIRKDIEASDGLLPESFETYQVVQVGDVVLRLTDLQNDKRSLRSALVEERGIITSAYLALEPYRIHSAYFAHLLRAYDQTKVFYSMGGGLRQSMKYADLKRLSVLLPTDEEQLNIATFLDHETAKIDALIVEQEKLIALLAEKRQATISNAVTRGLNPDVPMKDSGVAWLGEVPAHWHISPLKHLVSLRSGGTPSKENVDYWNGDIPWASAKDLKSEQLFDTVDHITTLAVESGNASLVPVGTVLIVVRGMILARTFPVAQALVPMAINQDLKGITPKQCLYAQFLAWLLRGTADESLRRLDEAGHGTKALRMDAWTSMRLPLPPVDEQSVITDFLEQETAKLDSLVASALRAIDLLKERRASFITAAVTGQIDVRGEVAAQTSTEEAATA